MRGSISIASRGTACGRRAQTLRTPESKGLMDDILCVTMSTEERDVVASTKAISEREQVSLHVVQAD
jgi:hypothetical protein